MFGKERRDLEFSEYVASRRSRLVGTAYLLCGDRHQAEDLVQTALAKLYVAWPRVRRSDGEDAYVRRILVNAGIDASRRPWRREHTSDQLPEYPADEGLGLEDRDELIAALSTLAPGQRRVIVLRYWLGLSVEEVATDLQITPGTVKSQSSKALQNLRHQLIPELAALTEEH
ncbi:RNA polymerase, sigma-24 subunit, ECF subfamily [Kribbella flavida DSM 17836]|uniref:RNA polymerase, sigma-24 subunit, ECF subfamily n=1 Tax=Kribbella flavida (strain DSM 17836 / JCM 10339 / NBRC 14399) TaxID=479435 RepID=D2PM48_KRIFD|nr:SigE family RNA polymerase sigma factor [Kribbella flavida]ADB34416.1 RNA polymerase, sigma-24 subunit, ECF subfamily [Kribbella flavida DSM 17836]